jgi:hypothetical protein
MKRMTSNEYNPCFNCNFYSSCSHIRENFPVCPERARYDRLAAIEDILGDEYDLGKLMELVQAKRKGRCIVLPCKKGDTVWRIVHDAAPHITKDRCTDIKYENRDIWVHLIGDRVMGGWNFGKLLFLTREDAEAALRREQE